MTNLITLTDPQSSISEAYRTLRINLDFYSVDKPLNTLLCASAEPSEESVITTSNLAVAMAQAGNRVILVDCDLRKPSLHTVFDVGNEKGFTDAIVNPEGKLALQSVGIENLQILTSGPKPPNPANLLGSNKVDEIIEQLKGQADMVLFNAPPIISVTDSIVLGSKVDGVLMILHAGSSRRDHAARAKNRLEQARIHIVGATLTNAPKDTTMGEYYG